MSKSREKINFDWKLVWKIDYTKFVLKIVMKCVRIELLKKCQKLRNKSILMQLLWVNLHLANNINQFDHNRAQAVCFIQYFWFSRMVVNDVLFELPLAFVSLLRIVLKNSGTAYVVLGNRAISRNKGPEIYTLCELKLSYLT